MKYKVTDSSGKEVKPGDTLTDSRGQKSKFQKVTRGPSPGKSAKVLVAGVNWSQEYYAGVFNLTVTEVP